MRLLDRSFGGWFSFLRSAATPVKSSPRPMQLKARGRQCLRQQPSVRRTLPGVRFCRFSGKLVCRAGMVCWGKYYWREVLLGRRRCAASAQKEDCSCPGSLAVEDSHFISEIANEAQAGARAAVERTL